MFVTLADLRLEPQKWENLASKQIEGSITDYLGKEFARDRANPAR